VTRLSAFPPPEARRRIGKDAAPAFAALIAAALLAAASPAAWAFELETDNPDLKMRLDTTVKYSNAFRVKSASPALISDPSTNPNSSLYFPNMDDGDRNFGRGLVSNRLDLLGEFDLSYKDFGGRVSVAGWGDSVYHRGTANTSPQTSNSIPYNRFTSATRQLHGSDAEVLDAFVFGKTDLGNMPLSVKLGRFNQLYGESFMMGFNGMAAAAGAVDVIKAASVPNSLFKEFMRPTPQISGQLQINSDVTVGGYYMLGWEPDRLPATGSYFSNVDFLGTGATRLIVGSSPLGNVGFYRQGDMEAKSSGQGGAQIKWHVGEVDYGLYAARWNEHGPQLYLHPYTTIPPLANINGLGLQVGTYQWVYHEGVKAVGGSFSTTVGNVNLAGEASVRYNASLDSDAQVDLTGKGNNSDNPLYAVGKTAHAQLSWIAALGPSFLAREADFVGELAWNRVLSVTKNLSALNPNATRDAANLRTVFEPKYRQVLPGLDLSVPVGLGWGLMGNSAAVGAFLGKDTGDLSIGVNGTYLGVWNFGLNYTHYLGKAGTFLIADANGNYHRSFLQSNADRDFISFNVRRTF
jgi:hypothetical protein